MPDHFFCIVLRDFAGNIDFFLSDDLVSISTSSGIIENIEKGKSYAETRFRALKQFNMMRPGLYFMFVSG